MNTKKGKRKSVNKEGQSSSLAADKTRLMKGMEYLKSRMKEHFKFFDNHSPELKKKRKGNSLSPPKGKNQSNIKGN